MLQMGSSRNRDPLKLSRDEDPSWDLEEPPKPRRKPSRPSRTYFMLFIIKIFINHHLAVTSLNLNWFQVLKCIFSGRRYDALRMVVQTQFFGWKFSQLGTYLFWTLHLCSYQCPPLGPSSLSWISTADDGYCCLCQTATQDCSQSKVCSTAQELTGKQHSSWNIVHKLSPQPALRKQQGFSSSESALAIGGMLQMSVHSWSILSEREAYDMLSFIPICCTIMYVFFSGNKCSAGTHT